MIITSFGPEDTYALGKRLGEAAKAGDVFCLNGDLGVGKTVFTQGFACGLGITEPVIALRLPLSRSMTEDGSHCTILTYTASAMSAKWTRWATRTIFMEAGSHLSSGPA